jgi:hypothetical protein
MDRNLFNPRPPVSLGGRTSTQLGANIATKVADEAMAYVLMSQNERAAWRAENPGKVGVINAAKNMMKGRDFSPKGNGGNGKGSKANGGNPKSQVGFPPDITGDQPAILNTGINVLPYDEDLMSAIEDVCSPLHYSTVKMEIPDSSSYELYDYFINVINFDLVSSLQKNVTWAIDQTAFTPAKVLKALNDLIYALSIYYYYNGIISYKSQQAENNEGMTYLRTNFTSEVQISYQILERKLNMIAIPPNLINTVKWFYSNYRSGPSIKSSLLKICPFPRNTAATFISVDVINTALADLALTDNNKVYMNLGRAVPSWRDAKLTPVPIMPVFDPTFNTVWGNLPYILDNAGSADYFPKIATGEEIFYCSYVKLDEIDGGVFSLTSMYNTTDSLLVPSLVVPVETGNASRWSFYTESSTPGWYKVSTRPILSNNRGETYVTGDFTDVPNSQTAEHRLMTQIVYNVSERVASETGRRMLNYLFDTSSIKPVGRMKKEGGKR